nr:transcription factor PHYTOCHROME INTERACTING FACTOR-LIKE 15-like [Malus domestica]
MLDDAIKYIKSLQLQVQMMSMGGGAVYQTPNLSLAGIQGTQMSQFKPYLPMGPGLGTSNAYEIGMGLGMAMGMINMCYTTGVPTMSVHSATAGLPLMSGPGGLPVNPQVQMQFPFLASQVMPSTTAATSNMVQPRFPTNFSRIFNYANQAGESSSPNTASDNEKVPFINQKSKVMASHVVTPTSN